LFPPGARHALARARARICERRRKVRAPRGILGRAARARVPGVVAGGFFTLSRNGPRESRAREEDGGVKYTAAAATTLRRGASAEVGRPRTSNRRRLMTRRFRSAMPAGRNDSGAEPPSSSQTRCAAGKPPRGRRRSALDSGRWDLMPQSNGSSQRYDKF